MVRRVDKKKEFVSLEAFDERVKKELEDIHEFMFKRAKDKMDSKITKAKNWKNFMDELN